MNINKVVHFFIDHNDTIIEWSTVVILLLVITWAVVNYFLKEETESNLNIGQLDQLEATLKKILEKGVTVAAPAKSSNSSPSAEPVSSEELDKLKAEVADREKTIKGLKAELEKAKDSSDDEGLKAKIQALEDRLAEYEIIEDDIADLSTYKEENAKLKAELKSLKSGGAVSEEEPTSEEMDSDLEALADQKDTSSEDVADLQEEEIANEATEQDPDTGVEELIAEGELQEEDEANLESLLSETNESAETESSDQEESTYDEGDDLVNEFESAMGGGLEDEPDSGFEEKDAFDEAKAVIEPEMENQTVSSDDEDNVELSNLAASAEEESPDVDGLEAGQAAVEEDLVAPGDNSNEVVQDDIFGEFVSSDGDEAITSAVIDEMADNVTKPKDSAAAGPEASLESLVEELNNEGKEESSIGAEEELPSTIDTDKMLNEMAELGEVGVEEAGSALEDEMDVDKMAAEASKLSTEN